jgi:hypothetical protein
MTIIEKVEFSPMHTDKQDVIADKIDAMKQVGYSFQSEVPVSHSTSFLVFEVKKA